MAVRVSVRDAAANTISSTFCTASEEAAAEPAAEDAVLEAEEPQAVRAAAAPAIPAAARKLRREILVLFMISAPVFKMNLCI